MKAADIPFFLELTYSGIAILIWGILQFIVLRIIKKRIKTLDFSLDRKKIVVKAMRKTLGFVLVLSLLVIWSIDHSDLLLFLSSALTILGVAFFAQWSHLSNITSGIILFFSSTARVGDSVVIMDKDFPITGKIEKIGTIFMQIQTAEGERINVPNNVFIQKPFKSNHN